MSEKEALALLLADRKVEQLVAERDALREELRVAQREWQEVRDVLDDKPVPGDFPLTVTGHRALALREELDRVKAGGTILRLEEAASAARTAENRALAEVERLREAIKEHIEGYTMERELAAALEPRVRGETGSEKPE